MIYNLSNGWRMRVVKADLEKGIMGCQFQLIEGGTWSPIQDLSSLEVEALTEATAEKLVKLPGDKLIKTKLGEYYIAELREIAGLFHDGQWSAFYAFSSSGAITPGLASEAKDAIASLDRPDSFDYDEEDENTKSPAEYEDMLNAIASLEEFLPEEEVEASSNEKIELKVKAKVEAASNFYNMRKNEADTYLGNLLEQGTGGIHRDAYWRPINQIFSRLERAGIQIQNLETKYYKNKESSNTLGDGKEWKFEVPFDKGGWHVQILASFAGSVKDPSDAYDIVITKTYSASLKKEVEASAEELCLCGCLPSKCQCHPECSCGCNKRAESFNIERAYRRLQARKAGKEYAKEDLLPREVAAATSSEISKKIAKIYNKGMSRDWDLSSLDDILDEYLPAKPQDTGHKDLWDQITHMPEELSSAMWKEVEEELKELEKADIADEIEVGDLVDFGPYGKLYVVDLEAMGKPKWFWVTDKESERFNNDAQGWSIQKYLAEKILEKGSELDEEDYEEEEALGIAIEANKSAQEFSQEIEKLIEKHLPGVFHGAHFQYNIFPAVYVQFSELTPEEAESSSVALLNSKFLTKVLIYGWTKEGVQEEDKIEFNVAQGPRQPKLIKKTGTQAQVLKHLENYLQKVAFAMKNPEKEAAKAKLEYAFASLEDAFTPAELKKIINHAFNNDDLSDKLRSALYDYYFDEMPYGTQKARTGDPDEFVADRVQEEYKNEPIEIVIKNSLGKKEKEAKTTLFKVDKEIGDFFKGKDYTFEEFLANGSGKIEISGKDGKTYTVEVKADPVIIEAAMDSISWWLNFNLRRK
jgi:hypothetical protein